VQEWNGITINIQEKQGDDLLEVEINRRVTNIHIGEEKSIEVGAGSGRGNPIYPELFASTILFIVKWIALAIGALYLALFLFSITELILYPETHHVFSHRMFLMVVLIYFLGFGFLMTQHGGQPDQFMHNYFSSRFTETWGIPEDDPTHSYFTTDNEYLYYWINGTAAKIYDMLLSVGVPRIPNRLLWRLLSVLLSTGTIFYSYKLTTRVTGNPWGGVLASFFFANTLMFVFISGGVSYDNFMILSSVAAAYHLVSIIKRGDYIKHTALLGIWLSAGSLAKNQIALLAFILFLVWAYISLRNRKLIVLSFSRGNLAMIAFLLFFSTLFLELYGGNLIQYRRPLPSCSQIKPDSSVCTNFSYRREQRQEVSHEYLWENRNNVVGPFEYALNFWLFNKINGIWGIISHNTFVPKFTTSLHGILIIYALLCLARYWKRDDTAINALILIAIAYVGYVFVMNYSNELRYGFRHYAVQGRYLFPVFGAFLSLMTYSLLQIRPLILKRLTLSLAIILYFGGGLGTFIFRYYDVFITWRIFF
jgi:4-amino-4-deoxy-L-arabinose transferase-like glycosyltransferase